MQEIKGLVSIVVPAYNAAAFLPETLSSVKEQTYSRWEVIVVNDGSTDNTALLVKEETDPRFTLTEQPNAGVSTARNNGLGKAAGEFVIFLDADDLLTPYFIESRVSFLNKNEGFGFAGGTVETFPVKSPPKKAAADNPEREILFFDSGCSTVPSNYMFRKKVLTDSGIRFNTNLNSTADRFFILELSKHTLGKYIGGESGKLLYRVNENSMSHHISPALILDNEIFYGELLKKNLLPAKDTRRFKSQYFYSLGLGFAKVKFFRSFIKYAWFSFTTSPIYFVTSVLRTLSRT